jgi:ABC-type multidrug transport system fused ATPase/permease subunit
MRKLIGVIPQETILFHDTIEYNILYGDLKGSNEVDMDYVLEQSSLTDTVKKLKLGLQTQVGERGLKLSSGEKQRIAIARVLVKKPKILLLDEATAALDNDTEEKVMNSLYNISRGMTTLMIAHRLNTIRHCDKIIVMSKKGSIAEIGTHDDLLKNVDGPYYKLWNHQMQKKEHKDLHVNPQVTQVSE